MLRDDELCMSHYRVLEEKEQCMKDLVSVQFQQWREILNQKELEFQQTIRQKFQRFDEYFESEKKMVEMVEDKGTQWQTSVCQILDNYQNMIQAD